MAHTEALNFTPRTFHSAPYVELQQSFRSQIRAISPSVAQVMRFIGNVRREDGTESEIETALGEALANAVIHGSGQNSCKRVYIDCRCYMDGEVSITVRDEGQGFDTSTVPDPTTPENRLLRHGRGIYLMKALKGTWKLCEGKANEILYTGGNSCLTVVYRICDSGPAAVEVNGLFLDPGTSCDVSVCGPSAQLSVSFASTEPMCPPPVKQFPEAVATGE